MGDVDGGPEWRIWVVVVHWDSGEWRVVDVFFHYFFKIGEGIIAIQFTNFNKSVT